MPADFPHVPGPRTAAMNPHPTPHPSPDRLDAFAVGSIGDAELAAIAAHVAHCPACCARLERVPADPMVSQLRAAASPGGGDSESRSEAVRAIRDGLFVPRDRTAAERSTVAGASSDTPNPFAAPDRSTEGAPGRIGEYELVAEVGRGGMGVVYRARHRGLNRPAAVKMILSGRFASESERRRFRLEAELAAQVRHPGVVQVYEVGEHDGCPFLAMEWIDGGSLADQLGDRPWSAAAAAELVESVAVAVQAAHDEGIVHRDLKPANILLAGVRGRGTGDRRIDEVGSGSTLTPASCPPTPEPKVADFGLARPAHGEGLTRTGVVAGTPEYMAPEQAAGGAPVGPAADVYALGVILYRLLAGRPPFVGDDPLSVLAAVTTREPPSPRRFNRAVPADLEAICLKCLEKRPHRRYEAARALADDLARFRAGRPVTARRVGAVTRAARWGRRNPGTAGLLTALAAAVLTGLGLVTWKWLEADGLREVAERRREDADAQRDAADARRRDARRNLYVANVRLSKQSIDAGQLAFARELLDEAMAGEPGDDDLRGFEWHYLHRLAHPSARTVALHPAWVVNAAASADGSLIAANCGDATLRVTDAADGSERFATRPPEGVHIVAVSPDGRFVAAAAGRFVQLWDSRAKKLVHSLPIGRTDPLALVFRPDGARLAVAHPEGDVQVWETGTGRLFASFRPGSAKSFALAYGPDGRRLAAAGADGVVRVCDAGTGAVLAQAAPFEGDLGLLTVAFSPDGRTVAAGWGGGTVRVVDAETGRTQPSPSGTVPGGVSALAFGPGGGVLAAACGDGMVRVWEVSTGRLRVTLKGHTARVTWVAFTTDGRVVSASQDRSVVEWDPAGSAESVVLAHPGSVVVLAVAYSADGRRLATSTRSGTVRLWDADTDQSVLATADLAPRPIRVAVSPAGTRFATVGPEDPTGRVWDAADGRLLFELVGHTKSLLGVAFSPDGRRLATGGYDNTARIWDADTGRLVRTLAAERLAVSCQAFSPDGRHLAAGSYDGSVRVWDADTGELLHTLQIQCGPLNAVAYRPDGRHLAAVGWEGGRVWDLAGGRRAFDLRGHTGIVSGVAYSPDGRRIATVAQDATLRVWDAFDGRELLTLGGAQAASLAFSPDGRRIAVGSSDAVRLLEAFPLPPELLTRRRLTE